MRTTTAFGKTALTSQGSQNSQTIISLSFFRKECTERPVTKEIEKCAKVGFEMTMSHIFALIITVKKPTAKQSEAQNTSDEV